MTTITDASTLRSLFAPIKDNPNEKRAKMIGQVMKDSGFAKPFLAYAMGQEMAGSEEWDANREASANEAQAATTKQAGDAAAQEYAQKTFTNIVKVSEKDPIAATQMLKIESEQGDNKYLQKFKGLTFNATTKDGWATVAASDGYVYHTYLPDLSKAIEGGPDSDIYKKTVVKIGEGKPQKAPETRTVQNGQNNVTQEWNGKEWVEVGKGPKFSPNADGSGKPRKEQDVVKDIRTTAAQIASRIGDASLTDAIIQATIKDPQVLAAMKSKKDPAIDELNSTLEYYKEEYQKQTGKPWRGGASPAPATAPAPAKGGAQQQSGTLSKDGKSVTVGGKTYTVTNGIATINGKKFKVQ